VSPPQVHPVLSTPVFYASRFDRRLPAHALGVSDSPCSLEGDNASWHGHAGCLAFTHSGGAQVAVKAEAQQPGTFASIYAFEPVLWPVSSAESNTEYESLSLLFAANLLDTCMLDQTLTLPIVLLSPLSAYHGIIPTLYQHS